MPAVCTVAASMCATQADSVKRKKQDPVVLKPLVYPPSFGGPTPRSASPRPEPMRRYSDGGTYIGDAIHTYITPAMRIVADDPDGSRGRRGYQDRSAINLGPPAGPPRAERSQVDTRGEGRPGLCCF